MRGSATHRPGPGRGLRAEQAGKLRAVYAGARGSVEQLWTLASLQASPHNLELFDEQAAQLKGATGELGRNATINELFNRLPLSVASAVAEFCETTRYAYWSKIGDKPGALQKKAVVLALLNELLAALAQQADVRAERRKSKTTEDMDGSRDRRGSQLSASASGFPGVRLNPRAAAVARSSSSARLASSSGSLPTRAAAGAPPQPMARAASASNTAAAAQRSMSPRQSATSPRQSATSPRQSVSGASLQDLVARFPVADLTARLAKAQAGEVDSADAKGRTALHVAVALDRPEHVRVLLSFRAHVNQLDSLGCPPLLMAAHKGNFDMCKLLLDMGADPNLSKSNASPMDYLVRHDPKTVAHVAVFSKMLDRGVSIAKTYTHNQSLLAIAVAFSNEAFVQMLLTKKGLDVNAANKFGETPLHIAARLGHAGLIKTLIGAGANPSIKGKNGTPAQVLRKGVPNRLQLQKLLLAKKGSAIVSPRASHSGGAPEFSASEPQMTDTLRRLAGRAGGQGDAFDMLNQLLQEASASETGRVSPPARRPVPPLNTSGSRYGSPNAAVSAASPTKASSPRALQRALSQEIADSGTQVVSPRQGVKGTPKCSECRKGGEGNWYQLSSLGEKEKRFICSVCIVQVRKRIAPAPQASPSKPRSPAPVKLPPGRHLVVAETTSPMLRVEAPDTTLTTPFAPLLEDVFEPYRQQLFPKSHMCFASVKHKTLIAFAFTGKEGFHKALAFSPLGHQMHDAKEEIVQSCSGKSFRDKVYSYVTEIWFPDADFELIPEEEQKMFQLELLGLEASHATNASAFRMGVVHWSGAPDEACNFQTTVISPRFQSFLDLMGETVQINSFSGYSGGFEDIATSDAQPDKTSYYISWLNLEIMYHVAPLLTADEQRRLIGNDLVLIIFNESQDDVFQPYEFRGNVNSIALVVRQISDELYTVGCFARKRVKEFGPRGGIEVPASELRNFLLTKAVNGILAAQKSPPFAQMISQLYTADIEKILEKFRGAPRGSKKNSRK